jgi:hypothetical protein
MAGQDYTSSITANISAIEATSRINRVADWWTAKVTGPSSKSGDSFNINWGETWLDIRVVELEPGQRVVWLVTDCHLGFINDKEEWKDTQIVFDISSNGSQATVKMTHVGLTPNVECYGVCETGWNFYVLESLENLLKENRGFPDMRGRRKSAEESAHES